MPARPPRCLALPAPLIPFSAILLFSLAAQASRALQAPAQTPTPEVVLHADTNLVLVDVVVTDKDRAIHGLHQPQFHITEDGQERTLLSVDEHTPDTAPPAVVPTALPPNVYTNAPQFPPQAAVNILLLDGLNTPMKDQARTRQQMLDYVATLPPGAPLAIFTLTTRLRLLQGFTSDPAILRAALKNSRSLPQAAVLGESQLNSSPGLVAYGSSVSQDGLTIPGAIQLFRSDMAALQSNIRVRTTLEALRTLGRYLDGIPGRKNLIWFSGSFPVGLDPEKVTSDAFQGMQDYTDELRKTSIVLNEARVALYPVDARGLMILPSADIEYHAASNLNRNGGQTASIMADNATATSQLVADHAAMHQIAEDTGGKSYANTGDFKGAVANAVAHGSSYYTLAFTPGRNSLGDKFHKLKVRIDGGSYTLAYRHGYFSDDHSQPASPLGNGLIAEATKRGAPPATQIIFQTRVLPASAPEFDGNTALRTAPPAGTMATSLKKPQRYVVDLRLDPASFAFTTDPNQKKLARVELSLVAYDPDGTTLNSYSQGMGLNLTPEQLVNISRSGLPLRALLDLPPGDVYLRVAIRDLGASRVGSLEVPLRVAGK